MSVVRKGLYVWIRTFVIILCIITAVLILLTTWMLHTFSKEISRLNYHTMEAVATGIDIRLQDINDFMLQLERSSSNIRIGKRVNVTEEVRKDMFSLKNQLDAFKMSNNFIEDIFIYYPQIDYIVGDQGYFTARHYYLLSNGLREQGYEAWAENVKERQNEPMFFYQTGGVQQQSLFLTKKLQMDSVREHQSILLLMINPQAVQAVLGSADQLQEDGFTAMLDQQRNIYVYAGNGKHGELLKELSPADFKKSTVSRGNYMGALMQSRLGNMTYITLIDK